MSDTPAFRPDLMTREIAYCVQADCPRAATCLRHLAYLNAEPFIYTNFVDPRLKTTPEGCEHYLSNAVLRYARGFKRGKALLSYGNVGLLRQRLYYELRCGRTIYYDYESGTKALPPNLQVLVCEVFAEMGVKTQDVFDRFEDAYHLPF